jgi:hypothetical protein
MSQRRECSGDAPEIENATDYFDEHLDDLEYLFTIAPKASGPNNYYATLAIMNTNEQISNNGGFAGVEAKICETAACDSRTLESSPSEISAAGGGCGNVGQTTA